MCPIRPYFVRNLTAWKYLISSRLKNINRTTADRLLTFKGCPDNTTRLIIIRSGLTDNKLPLATNISLLSTSLKHKTGDGGN